MEEKRFFITRRVGVDKENKEFNVFDEHSEGKFHGHVRQWVNCHSK